MGIPRTHCADHRDSRKKRHLVNDLNTKQAWKWTTAQTFHIIELDVIPESQVFIQENDTDFNHVIGPDFNRSDDGLPSLVFNSQLRRSMAQRCLTSVQGDLDYMGIAVAIDHTSR